MAIKIIGQIAGFCACGCAIASFQCKNNRHLYVLQMMTSFFFVINVGCLGSLLAVLLNVIATVRGAFLSGKNEALKSKKVMWLLTGACLLCCALMLRINSPSDLKELLTPIAVMTATFALYTGDPKKIRLLHLFIITPCFLAYDILIMSIGGFICDSMNLVSIIVSLIRFRGFRPEENTL